MTLRQIPLITPWLKVISELSIVNLVFLLRRGRLELIVFVELSGLKMTRVM